MLALHGVGGNALIAERMTGFTTLARSEGFIVVYPEGSARGRLRLLIGTLSRRPPIDPVRIFVTGMFDRLVPCGDGAPRGRFAHAWAGTPVKPAGSQARFWAQAKGCADPGSTENEAIVHVRFGCPNGLGVEL
ncbi:MAG: hypothetical protein MUD04_10445 [Cyanobium sp. Prado107]|nr:hypothetical protein [Cyanobium sp. Prado107]